MLDVCLDTTEGSCQTCVKHSFLKDSKSKPSKSSTLFCCKNLVALSVEYKFINTHVFAAYHVSVVVPQSHRFHCPYNNLILTTS